MDRFICPICKAQLIRSENTYKCVNRHSYDVSKHGYVNLIMSQRSSKKRHGDDKLMIQSRRDFLNKGYYKPLLDCITRIVSEKSNGKPIAILDAGCGDCYYSSYIQTCLPQCEMYGIDISKDALIYAHKRNRSIMLAAAGCSRLPFEAKSFDVLLNIFSPVCAEEYARVLKDDGILIRAVPLEDHLFGLKAAVYDTPYRNPAETHTLEGFTLRSVDEIKYTLHLDSGEDIKALFMMTPYYYKTSRTDQSKLDSLNKLETQAEFGVEVYTVL